MAGEEEEKQLTDFRETEFCPSAVVQRAGRRKNGCMREVLKVTGTLGRRIAISTHLKRGRGPHHTLRRLLIGAALLPISNLGKCEQVVETVDVIYDY